MSRYLRLVYPPSLLDQPILYHLLKQSDLLVNIRQAHITYEEGWLEVELIGTPEAMQRAVTWLQEQGIQVQHIPADKEQH